MHKASTTETVTTVPAKPFRPATEVRPSGSAIGDRVYAEMKLAEAERSKARTLRTATREAAIDNRQDVMPATMGQRQQRRVAERQQAKRLDSLKRLIARTPKKKADPIESVTDAT